MPKIWDLVSFVKGSKYREVVLKSIEKPSNPTKLKKELKIDKAHVSRALSSLVSKGLAVCLTPDAKKFKIFQITKIGKKILSEINRLNT